MKIVNIIGGLGNQMFQYAFALALKHHFPNEKVYIDTSHFKHFFVSKMKSANLHNGFEVASIFNLANIPIASPCQINQVSIYIPNYFLRKLIGHFLPKRKNEYYEKEFGEYDSDIFNVQGDKYFYGYWQHYEYFDDFRSELLCIFDMEKNIDEKNRLFIESCLNKENSVSIHVRRGDFLNDPLYAGICELDYYKAAIYKSLQMLGNDAKFYIFSNDIEWCRANISKLLDKNFCQYINWNGGKDSYKDMYMMSICRCNIIANSSFSWWAAYLNKRQNKIVIAPHKWVNLSLTHQIQLPEWIQI